MKKIYFYSPVATGEAYNYKGKHVFVNTAPAYLHSHLVNFFPLLADQIKWSKIQLLKKSAELIAKDLVDQDIDIFCASIYIWNQYHVLETIKQIKKLVRKKITIIVGGPSVNPHRDSDYFKNNPDIDYAIFAQGEQAFAAIIANQVENKKIDFFNTKNLAWPDSRKNVKLSSYEFIKRSQGSPYLDSKEILKNISQDPDYQDYKFYFPYETSRGCPYNCSFCDWTSGMSHKVSHRTSNDWAQELNLLGQLGFTNLHISDANFGQHRQDIEIARTMAQLKKQKGYDFFIVDTNFSKLKKKESFEILDVLLAAEIVSCPKFAVQDTNELVLKNIERPDIPWPEHKQYIMDAAKKYPAMTCQIEIIQGLPGQTRDTWEQTFLDLQGFDARAYPWVMLPNAPAGYDKEYQSQMKLRTINVCLYGLNDQPNELIVETYSYNFRDYMYMTLISRMLTMYLSKYNNRKELFARIRGSRHLETTLDLLEIHFKKGDKIMPVIHQFVDNLFAEHKVWPDNILQIRKRILGEPNEIN
jgi:radical SAM superfamily enzyme YgiQ (UPF0313 family)